MAGFRSTMGQQIKLPRWGRYYPQTDGFRGLRGLQLNATIKPVVRRYVLKLGLCILSSAIRWFQGLSVNILVNFEINILRHVLGQSLLTTSVPNRTRRTTIRRKKFDSIRRVSTCISGFKIRSDLSPAAGGCHLAISGEMATRTTFQWPVLVIQRAHKSRAAGKTSGPCRLRSRTSTKL